MDKETRQTEEEKEATSGKPKGSGAPSLLPRGTYDLLPGETEHWQRLESGAREVLATYGYKEIRIPIFDHTEIFKRGVGETTDIVNKEMYTFKDKSDRSLTLRPEGTASVVRAYLNGGLHRVSPPVKLWYLGPMFRYERVQTGRQRQFHQIGVEAFGSAGPLIDVEVMATALSYFKLIGLDKLELQINSIGCPICRPAYRELLKKTFEPHLPHLCDDCRERFHRNPLRMLDCKHQTCQAYYKDVPASLDHLCSECNEHWQGLVHLLEKQKMPYLVNKWLVRGLDYYTKTVFEVVVKDPRLGTQSTICAGGRYDHLVELFGGQPTPAVGWALGLERLILLMDLKQGPAIAAFVIAQDPAIALEITSLLRANSIPCDTDFPTKGLAQRAFGKQLQQANKSGAPWTVIAGEDELSSGEVAVKNMQNGTQTRVALNKLVKFLQPEK